nr:hypothetical protein [uncultured Rhodopila sp.]
MVEEDKPVADIAVALGLSDPTVRAHYAAELAIERPQLNFPFSQSGPARIATPKPTRRGRPEHVPTDATRDQVEVLIAGGMRQWQIAAALGISEPTLTEHYAAQLDAGRSKKKAQVIAALFKAGVETGNVSALKAWLSLPEALEEQPDQRQPQKDIPMGKKAAANAAAISAGFGTDWAGLLPN